MRWLVGLFLCVMCVVGGCNQQPSLSDAQGLVVKLHDRGLSRESLLQALPKRLSSADSLIWTESYLKQWIKDELVYDVAQRNMDDETKAEIDRLVDSYRRSLVRYRYQEQLVKERLSANITEAEKEAFSPPRCSLYPGKNRDIIRRFPSFPIQNGPYYRLRGCCYDLQGRIYYLYGALRRADLRGLHHQVRPEDPLLRQHRQLQDRRPGRQAGRLLRRLHPGAHA